MSKQTVIADNPPSDGQEWECQCARCGSSCDYENCPECEEGYHSEAWEEDCLDGVYYEGPAIFATCGGFGGWWRCLSSSDWCQANPLQDREHVKRGKIEWFVVQRKEA